LSRPAPYNNSPLTKIKQKRKDQLLLSEAYDADDDEAELDEDEAE
jgi:hypothetical protein